jgi:hypothetical protein
LPAARSRPFSWRQENGRRGNPISRSRDANRVPRIGKVDDVYKPGDVVITASGRQTTPFPNPFRSTATSIGLIHNWIMVNALNEAKYRKDEFNALQFELAIRKAEKIKSWLVKYSYSDIFGAEIYLFEP